MVWSNLEKCLICTILPLKYWTIGKGLAIKFWHGISVHVFVLEWN